MGSKLDPIIISDSDSEPDTDDYTWNTSDTMDQSTDSSDSAYKPSMDDYTWDSFDTMYEAKNPSFVDLATTQSATEEDDDESYEGVVDGPPKKKGLPKDDASVLGKSIGVVRVDPKKKLSTKKQPFSAGNSRVFGSTVGDNFTF